MHDYGPYCHANACPFFVFWGLVLVLCHLWQFSPSQGWFVRSIFGSELLFFAFFLWPGVFGGVCLCFLFISCEFAPEVLWKILFMSGLVFPWLVPSVLGFGSTPSSFFCSLFVCCFSREKAQIQQDTALPPPARFVWFFPFSFSVPAAFVYSHVLAVRPFCSCVSSGCHSGPRAFFGFSRDFSEAFFGREAAKAVARFLSVVFVIPLCGACGYTRF